MKKLLLVLLLISSIMLGVSSMSFAQYPEKEIQWIVPWAAGGSSDLMARAIGKVLPKYLGEEIVIVNKTGGAGTIANSWFKNQPTDGYTVIQNAVGIFNTQPYLRKVNYELSDYKGVIALSYEPVCIAVKADAPYDTLEEMVNYFKEKNKAISFAQSGAGSIPHITGEAFVDMVGLKGLQIAMEGENPAILQMLGGHVDFALSHPGSLIAKGDQVKILAITGDERFSSLPDVPTFKEQGYDINTSVWKFIQVPAGTPKERIEILHDAIKKAIEDPEFKKIADNMDLTMRYLSGDEVDETLKTEGFFYKDIIEKIGLGK